MKKAFILFAVLFLTNSCFAADTIFLKSGQKVSGKILEKTDEKVRIEVEGVALTYWSDSVDHASVEGEVAAQPKEEAARVPSEDGAKLYQEAFQKVKEPPVSSGFFIDKVLLDIEKNGWQEDARVSSLLNDNREAMDLFKKATRQSSDGYILGKFKINSTNDWIEPNYIKTYFSYLPLFNLILIDANQLMAKEQYPAAGEDFLASVGFIKHFAQQKEGGLLNSVITLIAENKAEKFIIASLGKTQFHRSYFERLLQALLSFPNEPELAQNWLEDQDALGLAWTKHHLSSAQEKGIVDPAFASTYLSIYEQESKKVFDYKINTIKMKDPGMFNPNPEDILGKLGEMKNQNGLDCQMETIKADNTLTDEGVACWMQMAKDIGSENQVKVQLWGITKVWGKSVSSFYLAIAKRNIFIAAVAVKLYQLDNGSLPSKLDDLVPQYLSKVPDDAFDSFKPVKYVQKPNGYLLYSFGPDRKDQKGEVVCDLQGGTEACDIALFVKQ